MSLGRKHYLFLFLYTLIIVAAALRALDCILSDPTLRLFSDTKRHWDNGLNFWHPGLMGASDPVLYQLYIWALRHLTSDNGFLIGALSGLLSILMPWTFYRAARDFHWDKYPALIAWALISWTPSLWSIYSFIMMETLLLPLLGLSLWMTARCIRKGTSSAFLFMVLVWTLTMLTKPSVLPVAIFASVYAILKIKVRISFMILGCLIAGPLLFSSSARSFPVLGFFSPFGQPWIARIIYRMPTKHIVIREGKSYCIFSSPSAYVRPLAPLSGWMIQRAYNHDRYEFKVDPQYGQRDWIIAYEAIPFGVKTWARHQFENCGLLLFAPSWPETTLIGIRGTINQHIRWIWAPLILLATIRLFWDLVNRKQLGFFSLATLIFILFLVFQPFALIEGRYRKPLEPLLILTAIEMVIPLATFVNKSTSLKFPGR